MIQALEVYVWDFKQIIASMLNDTKEIVDKCINI